MLFTGLRKNQPPFYIPSRSPGASPAFPTTLTLHLPWVCFCASPNPSPLLSLPCISPSNIGQRPSPRCQTPYLVSWGACTCLVTTETSTQTLLCSYSTQQLSSKLLGSRHPSVDSGSPSEIASSQLELISGLQKNNGRILLLQTAQQGTADLDSGHLLEISGWIHASCIGVCTANRAILFSTPKRTA